MAGSEAIKTEQVQHSSGEAAKREGSENQRCMRSIRGLRRCACRAEKALVLFVKLSMMREVLEHAWNSVGFSCIYSSDAEVCVS